MSTGDALGKLVQATNSDTSNGGAGPSIAATMTKIQKVTDLLDEIYKEGSTFPLDGADVIIQDSFYNLTKEEKRKAFMKAPVPILQVFYGLGVASNIDLFKDLFPHFNPGFMKVIEDLKIRTKNNRLNEKTMNKIFNDLIAYILTATSCFGSE